MKKSNGIWDWYDDSFCHDTSECTGLEIKHMSGGIGRLLHETQSLTEIIVILYARHGNIFDKDWKNSEEYKFTRANIESCRKVQEIRDESLGYMINKVSSEVKFGYEKDEVTLRMILQERNYFAHRFYAECLSGNMSKDNLVKACKRLKIAINTVVKFNQRNAPLIMKDIARLGKQSNVPLHTPISQPQMNNQSKVTVPSQQLQKNNKSKTATSNPQQQNNKQSKTTSQAQKNKQPKTATSSTKTRR